MNLLERLIGRAVGRLPSRRGPSLASVDEDGMLVIDEAVEHRRGWEEIKCVSAATAAGFIGETALLVIEFTNGATVIVPETDTQWNELTKELSKLPGAQAAAEWRLRLLAAPGDRVDVYRRG